MSADRTAWHEWRQRGIGASEVAGILDESPWASPWSIWASKVGLTSPDDEPTDSMQFGTDLEPVIAAWFYRTTGLVVTGEQTWCAHSTWPWARATVDGFVSEDGADADDGPSDALGVFEAKYTADPPWETVPRHYWLQVQWQMLVAGHTHAWLACMHLPFGRPTFAVYEIERDDAAVDHLQQRCEAFWRGYVVTGQPPPADGHQATTAAIRDAYLDTTPPDVVNLDADAERAVRVLAALKVQAKELATEITECENTVKAALGEHLEGHAAGERLVSWKPQDANRLDGRALKAAHPDIAEQFTKTTSSRVMRLHIKQENP